MQGLKATLSAEAPPPHLDAPQAALWWAAKGDWQKAHDLVHDEENADATWVHAYLHRVEGDPINASYWYRQAGKPVATGSLDAEWEQIAAALHGRWRV